MFNGKKAGTMAQHVEVLVPKPDNLSSSHRAFVVKGESHRLEVC